LAADATVAHSNARAGRDRSAGQILIRGAHIVTMDADVGDIPSGDVHIVGKTIAAVGREVTAPGAHVIDGRSMILMSGLIDTHTHLWSSQMRGQFGSTSNTTYFEVRNRLAELYTPEDCYQGTRLGAAESIFAGITTVVDFFHNNRGSEYVAACVRALQDTGIRSRFLFGPSTRSLPSQPVDLAALERLHSSWPALAGESPLGLGFGWRGPLGITSLKAGDRTAPELRVAREEFDAARRLSLPIAVHVSGHAAKGVFDSMVDNDFLGPDVQLVHFSNASSEDIKLAAQSGCSLALTPLTELRVGYGVTALRDYLDGGMRVGLGVDSNALAGAANMFAVMKLFQLIENGRLRQELAMSARRLLELATIEGARSIGLDREIGSVEVGKRADIIMVSTRALNMGLFVGDPAHLLVEAAQPANVDTVIIDGRILKRNGEMTAMDPADVLQGAADSTAAMLDRV